MGPVRDDGSEKNVNPFFYTGSIEKTDRVGQEKYMNESR
jgi:hypothetical protein